MAPIISQEVLELLVIIDAAMAQGGSCGQLGLSETPFFLAWAQTLARPSLFSSVHVHHLAGFSFEYKKNISIEEPRNVKNCMLVAYMLNRL